MLDGGSDRLIQANGLSLFAAFLDCPIKDTHVASIGGLNRTITFIGIERVKPEMFCDPTHFVRSTVFCLHRLVTAGNSTQLTHIFMMTMLMLKSQPEWLPYFSSLPMMYQMILEEYVGDVQLVPREKSLLWSLGPVSNEKCSKLTRKLRCCNRCGKLETNRGDVRKCSKCEQVVYCS